MRKIWPTLLILAVGIGIGFAISNKIGRVQAKGKPGAGFAAVALPDADLTQTILELNQAGIEQQAALQWRAKIPATSLFDYLG